MKTFEERIRKTIGGLHDETTLEADRRTLDTLFVMMDRRRGNGGARTRAGFREQIAAILKMPLFRLASASVLILGLALAVVLLNSSTSKAYAVEQTINAIDRVETVHMAGEFHRQGKFECWMRFREGSDEPAYLWLVLPRIPHMQRVCTPESSFKFNPQTGALFQCRRDERKQDWIIRFSSFFKEALEAAERGGGVSIGWEAEPGTTEEVIVVRLKSEAGEQKVVVDPTSLLPVKFVPVRENSRTGTPQSALSIRSLDWIRYNEPVPDGLFDVPASAQVVLEEADTLATPENGLDASGRSPEEACRALVERMGQAMIDGDVAGLRQCAPFFWIVPDEIFAEARATAEKTGRTPVELTVTGNVYREGDHWFLPCALRHRNGSREESTAMIKFYQFGERERCMVVGTKEKGMYD